MRYREEEECKYYKGLRQIDVKSNSEYVAWTNMQLCFRDREEESLDEHTAQMIYLFIGLYGKAFGTFDEIRALSLGGDSFTEAIYGLTVKMNYNPDRKEKALILDMLHFFLVMDTAEVLYQTFMRRVEIPGESAEDVREDCNGLIEELKALKPVLRNYLQLVEEEDRYVYVSRVY